MPPCAKSRSAKYVYSALTRHIEALGEIQAGCDRIASTPLPFAYSVLLHRAIYSFCIMLPFGIESVLGLWTPLMVAWLVYMFLGLDALSSQLGDPSACRKTTCRSIRWCG